MNETPERIYDWMNSHLSIARFFGGCTFNGAHYSIATNEEGHPLVRSDVVKREAKERRAAAKAKRDAPKPDQLDVL